MMNYSSVLYRYPILQWVGKVADQYQLETYVIGGFVRDLLLKSVSKDIDIVCVGSGIQLAKAVARAIDQNIKVTVFKNFGTAIIKWNNWEVEFVGARKESYRKDSRKPVVENGTLEDDQNRRDLTINAIAICLNHDRFGELIDPFEGLKDLQKKTIQTPLDPAITFSDDPLRMIRAIRFASQLQFTIAPATFKAIQQHAQRSNIVSKERIVAELHKIILAKVPSRGFKLLFDAGLLTLIFPELASLQGTETIDGKSHKDNLYHTLQVLDNVARGSTNLWLRWAALLHDIAKPLTKRFDTATGFTFHGHEDLGARIIPTIFRKMKLPLNEKMTYVQKLVRLHLRPIALVKDSVTDSAVRRLLYEAGDDVEDLMLLCRADITSNNPEKIRRYLQNFDKVEEKIRWVATKDQFRNFQPVITGNMIMQAFQLKPSRLVGEIKKAVREAILEGEIRNQQEEAYQYMLHVGKEKGLQPLTSCNKIEGKNKTQQSPQQ